MQVAQQDAKHLEISVQCIALRHNGLEVFLLYPSQLCVRNSSQWSVHPACREERGLQSPFVGDPKKPLHLLAICHIPRAPSGCYSEVFLHRVGERGAH